MDPDHDQSLTTAHQKPDLPGTPSCRQRSIRHEFWAVPPMGEVNGYPRAGESEVPPALIATNRSTVAANVVIRTSALEENRHEDLGDFFCWRIFSDCRFA